MKYIWNSILLTVFFTFVSVLASGVFSGFEITDEGFYLLMYEKPELYNSASRYFIIVSKLFGRFNPQIYHYRLFALILNLFGSYIFFIGLWQYLNRKFDFNSRIWNKLSAFLFIATGNLAAFFLLFKLLSYNDLNNFLLLSATGLIFLYLANRDKKVFSAIVLLSAGILIAFDVTVKFPSGIIYILFSSLFLFLERKSFDYCKLLLPGILVGFLIYFTFFESFPIFLIDIVEKIKSSTSSSHSLKIIVNNYSYFSIMALKFFFKYFSMPALAFIIALISYKLKKYKYTYISGFLACYLFIIAFLSSILFAPLLSEGNIHVAMPGFLLIIFFQLVFFLFTRKTYTYKPQFIYLIVFLMFLPFIAAFGSGAPITMIAYLHMAPLFAVFCILNLLSESSNFYAKKINFSFALIFIILCSSHLYFLYVKSPFRLSAGLLEQKYSVNNIKKLEHIKVDEETKVFLESLDDLMNKGDFKKNDYLIGHLMPGIVYIFDGISPGATYYNAHSGSKNIQTLVKSENILNKTYFLLPENCKLNICEYLEEKEILKNHEIIGKVDNPYKPNILFVPNTPLILYKPPSKNK